MAHGSKLIKKYTLYTVFLKGKMEQYQKKKKKKTTCHTMGQRDKVSKELTKQCCTKGAQDIAKVSD